MNEWNETCRDYLSAIKRKTGSLDEDFREKDITMTKISYDSYHYMLTSADIHNDNQREEKNNHE